MSAQFNLEKTLRRIEKQVNKIAIIAQPKNNQKTETWVKVSMIKALTGWNKDQLYYARKTQKIKMKKQADGIFYLLESLHPAHYK